MAILASWKAILMPPAFLARLRITLIVPSDRGVGVTLVREYGNNVDKAYGIMVLRNFNWPSVPVLIASELETGLDGN